MQRGHDPRRFSDPKSRTPPEGGADSMHMEPSSRRGGSGTSIDFDESIAPQDIRQAPRAAEFSSSRKKLHTRGGAAACSASDLLVGRLVQGHALQEPTFSSSPLGHVHCLSQPVRLSGSLGCEAGSILPLTVGIVLAPCRAWATLAFKFEPAAVPSGTSMSTGHNTLREREQHSRVAPNVLSVGKDRCISRRSGKV